MEETPAWGFLLFEHSSPGSRRALEKAVRGAGRCWNVSKVTLHRKVVAAAPDDLFIYLFIPCELLTGGKSDAWLASLSLPLCRLGKSGF